MEKLHELSGYTFLPDIADQAIPDEGILSRTVFTDDQIKAVLFAFASGEELSEHTASMPAILHLLQGEADLTLGEDEQQAASGAWIHMPAHLPHSVRAKTPLVLLLLLLKESS